MGRLGIPLDTAELQQARVLVAAIIGDCFYLDPLVFHAAMGEEPTLVALSDPCSPSVRPAPSMVAMSRDRLATLH